MDYFRFEGVDESYHCEDMEPAQLGPAPLAEAMCASVPH